MTKGFAPKPAPTALIYTLQINPVAGEGLEIPLQIIATTTTAADNRAWANAGLICLFLQAPYDQGNRKALIDLLGEDAAEILREKAGTGISFTAQLYRGKVEIRGGFRSSDLKVQGAGLSREFKKYNVNQMHRRAKG